MRIALSIATGILSAALGYPVTTVKGFMVCISLTFIVIAIHDACVRK